MKKTVYTCDFCGKEITVNNSRLPSEVFNDVFNLMFNPKEATDELVTTLIIKHSNDMNKEFDLCHKCALKFADILDDMKKKKDEK